MGEAFIAGAVTAGLVGLLGMLFRWRGRELSTGQLVGLAIPVAIVVFLLRQHLPFASPPPSADALVEEAFRENPSLGLIAKSHPEMRQDLKRLLDSLITAGASRREAYAAGTAWGRAVLTPYLKQYLPIASDEALRGFGKASTHVLEGLRKTPEACMDYLFGAAPGSAPPRLSEENEGEVGLAILRVVRTGTDSPHDPLPPDQARKAVQALMTELIQKWGTSGATALEAFTTPARAREDPGQSCNIAYQLYRHITSLPDDEAATTLRALFSAQ